MPNRRLTTEEWTLRFVARSVHQDDGCWLWEGFVSAEGYGRCQVRRNERPAPEYAHRLAYELWVGPIPDGYDVDHLCHNADLSCPGGIGCRHRRCVNPAHLEAVTKRENRLRQRNVQAMLARTHCSRGHLLAGNFYIHKKPNGRSSRECKTCTLDRNRRWRESKMS